MAQRSENREDMAPPSENVESSAAVMHINDEQGLGEKHIDVWPEAGDLRESPSSQVGYGGGDDRYYQTSDLPNQQGHWDERNRDRNEEQSGPGTTGNQQGRSRDGSVQPNGEPHESGFCSSDPASYPEDGGNVCSHCGIVGTAGDGELDGSAGYDSEVRGGVPHRLTSDGVASGAGVSDDGCGGGSPASTDIEHHQYHLAEANPSSQKDTPYSQQLTQPQEEIRYPSQDDEGVKGNTKGGTAHDHHQEAPTANDAGAEGFLKKFVRRLPGHSNKLEVTNEEQDDIQHADSDAVLEDNEDEKPGVITRLKEKLRPNHDKHHDEINPEIFE